jgi:hypothetical protein
VAGATRATQRTEDSAHDASAPEVRSVLMVDCGSAYTKVALAGLVEQRYRLSARAQAPTTSAPPITDVIVGVFDAIAQIERTLGRPLVRDGQLISPEQDDGSGVDAVSLTVSAGGPLRLLTAGPGREALAGLLYRAIGGLFVELQVLPPTAGVQGTPEWQRLVAQMHALHPQGILVVGAPFGVAHAQSDIDSAATDVFHWIEELRVPQAGAPPSTPAILFTGSAEDGAKLASLARQHKTYVQTVDMLSPSTLGPVSRAVGALYEASVLRQVPGYQRLRPLVHTPPLATDTALGGVVRYLAQHYQMTVIGVDVGASSTSLAAATAEGTFIPADAPNAGVGVGAGYVWRAAGAENILRWLPWNAGEQEVREYVLTRMTRPRALPATTRELAMEHALAREGLRLALHAPGSRLAGLHPVDVVLGSGGVLGSVPHPGHAALILLDSLQPRGITSLVVDTAGLATMLGAIPGLSAQAAAELSETDAVSLLLGSVISTTGQPPGGQPAMRMVLEYADGRQQSHDIPGGTLVRLPLAPGERATLSLYPHEQVDIGLGPGQHARASEPIEGGTLGLIVDTRGRPLALPTAPDERAAVMREWQQALGVEA